MTIITTKNTVVVAGSRDILYESSLFREQIKFFMDRMHETNRIEYLIEGGHSGVDSVVREWRKERDVPGSTFYADWEMYGPRAGAVRNKIMVEQVNPIHLMIIFPGSLGTNSMKAFAESFRIGMIHAYFCETEEEWKEWKEGWEQNSKSLNLRHFNVE